jgi:hypothetical protein
MWTIEKPRSNEKLPSPKEIDTWVFSQFKINALPYLLSLDMDSVVDFSELTISDKTQIDAQTLWILKNHVWNMRISNPDIPVLEMIATEFSKYTENISIKDLWQLLIDYPTLQKILRDKSFMSKLQDNQDKKIITPKGICKIVGTKFFSNYKKEILTDEATGKSLLVIYGTGKNKKYITIYDPMYSLQPAPE